MTTSAAWTTNSTRTNTQWWAGEVRGREHERLWQVASRLRLQDAPRREACLRRMRMYGNYALWATAQHASLPNDRLRYNLVKQGVDTLLAEISSSKPKATFLVDGGDWTLRQAAKACDQLVEAQMRDAEIYDGKARAWLKDAEITGTGVLYDYIDLDSLTPKVERVLPLELLVDEADGRYGCPRQMLRQRTMDRGVLKGMFPEKASEIDKAPRFSPIGCEEWLMRDSQESDLVLVIQGWHLRSSKRKTKGQKGHDGRYVMAIENATLETEEYDDCHAFPFTILRWEEAPVGFWGVGVVEQLESDQVELNRTLRRIQEAGGAAAGTWLLHGDSKVKGGHLTDVPGGIVRFYGARPEYVTPATIPMDLIQHADRIIARGLQRLGISESFANAIKPVGLNSGEAQRVHSDIYSRRQVEHAQRWDTAHVQLAKRMVARNREIWEIVSGEEDDDDAGDRESRVPTVLVEVKRGRRKQLKPLRWKEASLPENKYVIQAYPTSSLPSEPSGRAALISEWIEAGLIDQQTAKELQDLPDTRGAMNLELADFDFALFCFETMTEDGEYIPPEPYQNLAMAMELIRRSYLRAVIDGVPDDRLQLVRDHMTAIDALMKKAAKPDQMAEAVEPQQMPPGAVPVEPAPELAGIDPNTLQVAA